MSGYLFAYGTLRKEFGLPVVKELEWVGEGRIEGRMYDLGEYPGAVPGSGDAEAGVIEGDVFFAPASLDAFDEYEGDTFVRRIGTVRMADRVVEAWVYWYVGDVAGRRAIEETNYLNYLKSIKPK